MEFHTFERINRNGQRERLACSRVAPDRAQKPERPLAKLHVINGNQRLQYYDCLPVDAEHKEGSSVALVNSNDHIALQIDFAGAKDISIRQSFDGDVALVWDDLGRVIRFALEPAEVTYSNVALNEQRASQD